MKNPTSDVAFTPSVKAIQTRLGSRRGYEKLERMGGFAVEVTDDLAGFIADRTSFYLATATADGQPYIQHRGGPAGFLKVVGPTTLAFADYAGNRQYLSMGNLEENDRAFLFLMDYAHRQRIKIWGRARFVEDDAELIEAVHDPESKGRPERVLLFEIEAWDVNCPQHIPVMLPIEQVEARERALRERVIELQAEVDALRA